MNRLDPLTVELAGLQLVEASAGTGKTFAITTLALRGVLAGIDVGAILVVTFTNAATAELRRRLRERLALAFATYADLDLAKDDPDLRALVCRRVAEGHADADRRRLRAALDGFDEAAIFTIHGFCQRALRELAFESGAAFDVELVGDPRPLLADAVRDVWTARLFDAPLAMVARLADERVDPAAVAHVAARFALHRELAVRATPADDPADPGKAFARRLMREAGPAVLRTLGERKAAADVQDFDDLLHHLDQALRGPSGAALAAGIGRRYRLALIDEFQDTDPVQYRIFRELRRRTDMPLFLIGDPKQAIYAFRGADVFAYLDAQREARDQHTLLVNWRSSPRLVRAVNTLFTNAPAPFVVPEIEFRGADPAPGNRDELGGAAAGLPPMRVLFARRADFGDPTTRLNKPSGGGHWLYRSLADQVVELLDGGTTLGGRRVRAGDVAVLCRKNQQLLAMGEALRVAGVPSVALADASVFESPEALMLEQLLRALAEPGDALALRVALVTPLVGLDSEAIRRLNADEAQWDLWGERFQRWNERWRGGGVTAALRGLLDELGVPERILASPGGERRMTNLLHLAELLQQAASESRRGPHGLVDWLHRMRTDVTLREIGSEAAQIRLESDAHAVALITIHKSKGLQYPVVFCPFQWEVIDPPLESRWPCFHDEQRRLTIDLGMPAAADSGAQREREAAAEEARLLYVAVTRARQLCVLVWAAFNGFHKSALADLLHRRPRRDADGATVRDAAAISRLPDAAIEADLRALADASDGGIALAALPPPRGRVHVEPAPDAAALVAPPPAPAITQAWRIASFTSLSAGGEVGGLRAEEGIDRDEVAAAEEGGGGVAALRGFPRGRGPGTLVHRILELAEFDGDPAALRALVERQLASAHLGAEWIAPLGAALQDVFDTRLLEAPDAPRLRDVPRARRLSEMEFAFPLAGAGRRPLTPERLADVFARHGGPALAAYADRLRRLPFRPLSGYLRGYIDCVFAHAGRWYVVDYKSNDLGPTPAHYAPAALAAEMARHDYLLQLHLYLVAVHRYLRRRLPGYAYERHVGGALYLFVRGMSPARGPATGVVHAAPPAALIERLSELLGGAGS